jgi:hypothetical protein
MKWKTGLRQGEGTNDAEGRRGLRGRGSQQLQQQKLYRPGYNGNDCTFAFRDEAAYFKWHKSPQPLQPTEQALQHVEWLPLRVIFYFKSEPNFGMQVLAHP